MQDNVVHLKDYNSRWMDEPDINGIQSALVRHCVIQLLCELEVRPRIRKVTHNHAAIHVLDAQLVEHEGYTSETLRPELLLHLTKVLGVKPEHFDVYPPNQQNKIVLICLP
jgi:hypothetical protein